MEIRRLTEKEKQNKILEDERCQLGKKKKKKSKIRKVLGGSKRVWKKALEKKFENQQLLVDEKAKYKI